ncbi:hypothetical protein Glove_269g64 [Diversispora epigaea]|uniref:Protein kinase domain-containing protein n=1 Tax=Diversispora epigaea TaxID=1348612 RepID=A0A397IB58_9GLOM|nr:hypothetical protein Glove_269g64 [Diversispora epigaea]
MDEDMTFNKLFKKLAKIELIRMAKMKRDNIRLYKSKQISLKSAAASNIVSQPPTQDFQKMFQDESNKQQVLLKKQAEYETKIAKLKVEIETKMNQPLQLPPGHEYRRDELPYNIIFEITSEMEAYKDLLADLNGLLNTNPKNVHALRRRGAIYCAIGNYKESLTDLNKSLKIETNNTFALRNCGKVFYKLGKYDEASADFNNSLEIESNNAFITNDKEIYSMIDKYEQAFSNYTKLLEIDPNDVFTLRNCGATCRVLEKCEEWLLYFKTPFDINPSNKWELGDNGEIYLKNGKYYEALANLNKSLEIEPNNIDALKIRGETFYMMGKNNEALKDLNLILKIEPNNSFALKIRGTIYRFLMKHEESLADLNESLGISPNNVLALRHRGITYRRMYKYNESLADLNKLQEIEPNCIFTLFDQGQIYCKMDKMEKSLVNLNKFLKNCPNDFDALSCRGDVYNMNKCDESIADYNKALEILNKLIEIDFNNAFVLYFRGEVYRLLAKYDKALKDMNKSLAINPNDIFALANRGEIYRKLKKYEEALEDVNKVLKKDPNCAWTLVTKGAIYYDMEKYEEAFTFLEKSLEIHPHNFFGMDYFECNIDPGRMDLYNYHLNTDWNMDDNLYWGCDVEKCEYWDLDVEFSTSTEITLGTEVCDECNQPCAQIRVISTKWCQPCNSSRFQNNFKNWTSNNTKIDDFIQKLQLVADRPYKVIEWIPFNRLRLVKYMTKGGFGSVFSAIWQDGQIRGWDINDQKWIRVGIQSVALKTINNPMDPISDLLKEIESNIQVVDDPHFIRCLGITQDSKTHNYMMVMEYATSGSLRAYMNANNMDVYEKGRQLWAISKGLYNLHEKNLIHQDFHPGNLLLINGFLSISDFVLPYIAPEVLSGEEYTMASDIYSFGIIACELITGYPPYYKIPHNSDLALKICQGLRPKIPSEVPKIMARLIEECWDADPKKRPTSKQLFTIINKWLMSSAFDKFILPTSTLPSYKLHPEAIYTSRLFNTTSSKPVNASNFMKMFSKSTKSTSEDLCKVSKSVRFSELLGRLTN